MFSIPKIAEENKENHQLGNLNVIFDGFLFLGNGIK